MDIEEYLCAQIFYIGLFDNEPVTVEIVKKYIGKYLIEKKQVEKIAKISIENIAII